MIKLCPNCDSERALAEMFCEGTLADGAICGWNLIDVPLRLPGTRPTAIETTISTPSVPAPLCTNGHTLGPGDLICPECGADPAAAATTQALAAAATPRSAAEQPTVIAGWRLESLIGSTPSVYDRYQAIEEGSNRRGILTLYQHGAEPDPDVYETIRRLPRDYVPEYFLTGRWEERAYEVAEELAGGTLRDLTVAPSDRPLLRRIVTEIGEALNAFAEVGIRHRELRPTTILVRSQEPLDLVIVSFGSARLSESDLDIAAPLETTRYMAPEAIAGAVAPASDWWSLGMILLEKLTAGACFAGANPHAFLIHVIANGVSVPETLDPELRDLLRGLLARDHNERWQWKQVSDWLEGKPVPVAQSGSDRPEAPAEGASITLGGRAYRVPSGYALAAAEVANWAEALDHLERGVLASWAQSAALPATPLALLRQVAANEEMSADFRLALALKTINRDIPLIRRGEIVTPGWLLQHPLEAYELITGTVPDYLTRLQTEPWIVRLKARAAAVRQRAEQLEIELAEDLLRINLLSTSKAKLIALLEDRRKVLPDTSHRGLLNVLERKVLSEEDLIVVLSASISQFRSAPEILAEAAELANANGWHGFDRAQVESLLSLTRRELNQQLGQRTEDFARCELGELDLWADQFRVDKRLPLARQIVLLSVPAERWKKPPKQKYVKQLLEYFEKKVTTSVMRGPLVRMTIGKTTTRVDLTELETRRLSASALLDQFLQRSEQAFPLDPTAFAVEGSTCERRLNELHRHTNLFKRDTGLDGGYLGFPFLFGKPTKSGSATRLAPILLWPMRLMIEIGARGSASIAFDAGREEVRLNPALESIVGPEMMTKWREAATEILERSSLKLTDVVTGFGHLAEPVSDTLRALPGAKTEAKAGAWRLEPCAVIFHVTFAGQAIGHDLRALQSLDVSSTSLSTMLRLIEQTTLPEPPTSCPEKDRFFTAPSDPSQESAVLSARAEPGLLIEGPPGTGKSQTIVNMVCDAIGRKQSLLVVCQKHAALEVVHKRLVAEDLGQRIVMVNDVNQDREPTIRMVREQLEAIAKRTFDPAAQVRRARDIVAARIDSLEGMLDRHHVAIHAVHEQAGVSYRTLVGELLALETPNPPPDVPALRSLLRAMAQDQLAIVEEECASVAKSWLPAKFEGSAWAASEPFATDEATLSEFKALLLGFGAAEKKRLEVIGTQAEFPDVQDPAPYRTWLSAKGGFFLDLPETDRKLCVKWLPLFEAATAARTGRALLAELSEVLSSLEGCQASHHDGRLSSKLIAIPEPELARLRDRATEARVPRRWYQYLDFGRSSRLKDVRKWLVAHGELGEAERIGALADSASLELAWRPLRQRLTRARTALSVQSLPPDAGPEMEVSARSLLAELKRVGQVADEIAAAPNPAGLQKAVMQGTRADIETYYGELKVAFERHAARHNSTLCLRALSGWMKAEWIAETSEAIAANQSNAQRWERLRQAWPTLPAYQQYRGRAGSLSSHSTGVLSILRSKESVLANIAATNLGETVRTILRREVRLAWKAAMEAASSDLLLEREELASKIAALEKSDQEMRTHNRDLLKQDLDVERIRPLKQWEDITRLRGPRARRLREFLEQGSELGLLRLRPIWLMNPDTASRVLPLTKRLFDTVIYDEASQMPVEFALPTLYRARISVVSGDEKQMPPTAFFSSRVENDEAASFDGEMPDEEASDAERDRYEETWNRREIKDCPDLLQLARSSLPTCRLQIHYRSAYRELIAYSNACFYSNDLSVPVRHPDRTIQQAKPIEYIAVNGVYDAQTNRDEAARVVEEIARIWQAPAHARPSTGIVTFNRKQADLIEELLEDRAESDEAFRAAYRAESQRTDAGEDMGVFVKNVENVQGDERDVIIFSSTFGRNRQGSFLRNFGVLGQAGGERRLNVAVTRARKKVVMVTSMPLAEIADLLDTHRPPSTPREYLQGYMEYARSVSSNEFPVARSFLKRCVRHQAKAEVIGHRGLPDGFVDDVGSYLRSIGLLVADTTEDDVFGLDFAIEDPSTGLYAVGVECDAPRHRLLARARAREIWRQKVLGRSISAIHRVSSQAWYQGRSNEQQRLRMVIERALNGGTRR